MSKQLDYIFFFYGFGFILLAAVCCALGKTKKCALPWTWLGLFGLIHGVNEWLDMLALSLGDSEPFKAVRICVMAASFVCLVEFGRLGMVYGKRKRPGRWVTLALVAVGCLGWSYGWIGVNVFFRYALGFIGGLWVALAFIASSRRFESRTVRVLLLALGVIFGLYAVVSGLIVPKAPFFPASFLNQAVFMDLFGFPIQLLRGSLAVASAVCVWQVLQLHQQYTKRIYIVGFVVASLSVIAGGWVLTERIGNTTQHDLKDSLLSTCAISAATIPADSIAGITASSADLKNSDYQLLKQKLTAMRAVCPEYRYMYLLMLKGSQIVFLADSEPIASKDYSAPGEVYADAPDVLKKIGFAGGESSTVEYTDRWGNWVSAFVPIKDKISGKTIAVFGVDRSREALDRSVARERLNPILITLLAMLSLIAFYIAYARQMESLERIALSADLLRQKEENLSCTLQSIGDAVITMDCAGSIMRMNPVAEALTGWSASEAVGRPVNEVFKILNSLTRELAFNPIEKVLATGESSELADGTIIVSKNGIERQIADSCSPVRDSEGACIGVVLVFRDITEEHRLVHELRESECLQRQMLDNIDAGVVIIDPRTHVIEQVNVKAQSLFKGTEDQIIGHVCHCYLCPAEAGCCPVTEGGEDIENSEKVLIRADGSRLAIVKSVRHIKINGEDKLLETFTDITKRKQAQEALQESETQLRLITDSAQDAILMMDPEGRVSYWNPAAEKILGYTSAEAIGKNLHSFIVPSRYHDAHHAAFSKFAVFGQGAAVGKTLDLEARRKDGTEISVQLSLSAIQIKGSWHSVGLLRDITERKLAEEALKKNAEQLKAITSNVPGVVYEFYARPGSEFGLHYVSEKSMEILGLENDPVTFFQCFVDCAPADERHRLLETVKEAVQSRGSWNYEGRFIKPTGEEIYISGISSSNTSIDDELVFTGVILDITEQKRAKDDLLQTNRRLEETLCHANDMAVQAMMAGEALQHEKDNLAAIFASSPVGMLLLDEDTTIVDANDIIADMVARSTSEIIYQRGGGGLGCVHSLEHPKGCGHAEACVACPLKNAITQVLAEGSSVRGAEIQATLIVNGQEVSPWLRVSAQPVSINGRKHVVVAVDNITDQKNVEKALVRSESLHKSMTSHITDVIAIVGGDGLVKYKSPNIEKWFGWHPEELVGVSAFETVHPDDVELVQRAFFSVLENKDSAVSLEYRYKCKDGSYRMIELTAFNLVNDPVVNGVLVNYHDITARKLAETHIRLHSAAINAADDLIAILDSDGFIVFANDSFRRQVGCSADELIVEDLSILWPQPRNRQHEKEIWAAIEQGSAWSGEMPCRSKDDGKYTADVTITPLTDEESHSTHLIMIARNITERKEYEGLLDYKAHHDALTDLPNRFLFSKELAWAIPDHGDREKQCAVLFIDLDKFKMVNDTMGHQAGDTLLVETASRLRMCLRDGDVLARMGGDEFTVLLKNIESLEDVAFIAQRMLEAVWVPYEIDGTKLVIGASIGVSIYPDNAKDVAGLLKFADAAMYKAKELGRNNCQFFSADLSQANDARVEMEQDLRLAMERDELKVYYQPIVDLRTMQIAGAEALLRWEHPEKGFVSPSLFVPVAEETGLILELGRMAMATACKQCKSWQDSGYDGFEMSVNVSPTQLSDIGFVSEVEEVLSRTCLSRDSLKIEVTETVLAKNDYDEVDILSILRSLGVQVCLDDFGVGYSSLSRLKNLPIVHMKIDGYFIRNIERSSKDKAMTESIIVMAHNLGIQVTAEWIEDEEQLATIKALGCDYGQGYLISPALPADQFERFMQSWTASQKSKNAA